MAEVYLGTPPAKRPPGRRCQRGTLTAREAKQRAAWLLADGRVSPALALVLDALAVGGVLTAGQLQRLTTLCTRTLQRYHHDHLLDRLYTTPPLLREVGVAPKSAQGRLYTLGIVGEALARHTHARLATGYTGYGVHRVAHDVLVNEIVLRLAAGFHEAGLTTRWRSKYEATLHDRTGTPVLEPDALLLVKRGQTEHAFVLEYHNEDHAGRAQEKLRRYEGAARDGRWSEIDGITSLPLVLVVWHHQAVAQGFRQAYTQAARMGVRHTYLGKPLQAILSDLSVLQWHLFRQETRVDLRSLWPA